MFGAHTCYKAILRALEGVEDQELIRIGKIDSELLGEDAKPMITTVGVVTQMYGSWYNVRNVKAYELQIDDGVDSCTVFALSHMTENINLGSIVKLTLKHTRDDSYMALKLETIGEVTAEDVVQEPSLNS